MMKYEAYEKPEVTVIELGAEVLTADFNYLSSNANTEANTVTENIDTFLSGN